MTDPTDVAREIAGAAADVPDERTLVSVFMSARGFPPELAEAGIPSYAFPEDAARALGRVAEYARWRSSPHGDVVRPDGIDAEGARAVVDAALRRRPDGEPDTVGEENDLPERAVHERSQAADGPAATWLGTDVAGSFLDAYGVRFAPSEVVGSADDPSFGPLLMAGFGGTLVELLQDVSVRVTPVTDVDIDEMLRSLKAYELLTGYRGSAPADVAALEDLLHRVNAMVEDLPEVVELDLNPVFVGGSGAVAVDVRMSVAPLERDRPGPA